MRAAAPGHQDRHRVSPIGRERIHILTADGDGVRFCFSRSDACRFRGQTNHWGENKEHAEIMNDCFHRICRLSVSVMGSVLNGAYEEMARHNRRGCVADSVSRKIILRLILSAPAKSGGLQPHGNCFAGRSPDSASERARFNSGDDLRIMPPPDSSISQHRLRRRRGAARIGGCR